LHERGNFEAFALAASKNKWLEVHGGDHDEEFRLARGIALEKRFFDYFLKGEKNGWDKEPRVLLNIRYPDQHFELRSEDEWPLARTKWTKAYLDANDLALSWTRPVKKMKSVKFEALGEGVTFTLPPLEKVTEITGPLSARLFLSSSTTDADIFLTLIALDENEKEITFHGASEPRVPLAQGWLRASHRHLDKIRSKPYRPYHTHDRIRPLKPGSVYQLDIEIWPTCVVLPPKHHIALVVQGKDYERQASETIHRGQFRLVVSGSGHFLHNNPDDRPASVFGGKTTIYTGGDRGSYVLLPIIPN
jgi:predicted acyl esterase